MTSYQNNVSSQGTAHKIYSQGNPNSAINHFNIPNPCGECHPEIIHRVAAVALIISTVWHILFLFTARGKRFFKDMLPGLSDLKHLIQRVFYNLGFSKKAPDYARFSYVEKVEYWALIWGNGVMILTGILLWFDNTFIKFFSKGVIEVALVIHFYEAILATLAILIWHLYSTVFNPQVYPKNPSWLTGRMPKDMFEHEHPAAEVEKE